MFNKNQKQIEEIFLSSFDTQQFLLRVDEYYKQGALKDAELDIMELIDVLQFYGRYDIIKTINDTPDCVPNVDSPMVNSKMQTVSCVLFKIQVLPQKPLSGLVLMMLILNECFLANLFRLKLHDYHHVAIGVMASHTNMMIFCSTTECT